MFSIEMDLDAACDRLRDLERALPTEDRRLVFHLREMILDLIRHARAFDEIAAGATGDDLEVTYRRIDDLRADIEPVRRPSSPSGDRETLQPRAKMRIADPRAPD
jgi:hypothetical protein